MAKRPNSKNSSKAKNRFNVSDDYLIIIVGSAIILFLVFLLWRFYFGDSNVKGVFDYNQSSSAGKTKSLDKQITRKPVTGISDSQIEKDLKALDLLLANIDSGFKNIDNSLNDKPANLQ